MKIEPGTRVRIIQDCRDGSTATGQYGVYEGDFPIDIEGDDEPFMNPRIRLDDGSEIWGIECWWDEAKDAPPLDKAQSALEKHKEYLCAMLSAENA